MWPNVMTVDVFSRTCRQTTYLQVSVTGEMLAACEDVKRIELSEDRVTGVPVISVMNLRIITNKEFLLFVGKFCLCVCSIQHLILPSAELLSLAYS
jgi:hypothetical protein